MNDMNKVSKQMRNDLGLILRGISKKTRERRKAQLDLEIQEDSTSLDKNSLHYRQNKQQSAQPGITRGL